MGNKWYGSALVLMAALLSGCATLTGDQQPPVVTVANLQPLPSQGLVPRFKVTLELQNRNNRALSIQGLDFDLEVDGRRFASGVSATSISLQPLGRATAEVEVTVNGLSLARQLFDWLQQPPDALRYAISGHLHLNKGFRRRLAFSQQGKVPLQSGSRR